MINDYDDDDDIAAAAATTDDDYDNDDTDNNDVDKSNDNNNNHSNNNNVRNDKNIIFIQFQIGVRIRFDTLDCHITASISKISTPTSDSLFFIRFYVNSPMSIVIQF